RGRSRACRRRPGARRSAPREGPWRSRSSLATCLTARRPASGARVEPAAAGGVPEAEPPAERGREREPPPLARARPPEVECGLGRGRAEDLHALVLDRAASAAGVIGRGDDQELSPAAPAAELAE